jgi:hypothetical protein
MNPARLTEKIIIEQLNISGTSDYEVIEIYVPIKTLYVSILNDRNDDNNQSMNIGFDQGSTLNNSIRFYSRFLQLPIDLKNLKLFRVNHNGNYYYISSLYSVANRSATIINCSTTV